MSAWISPAQAAEAMERGDGRGVRVAVLDSGIETSHPYFSGRHLHDDLVSEANGNFQPGSGEDLYGHGTAVAGIIWKLAPKAEIGSFRVLGSSLSARTAQVSVAARRCIALGYQVLNCSFGCGISGHLPLYKEWVDSALLSGIHVVAASEVPTSLNGQPISPVCWGSIAPFPTRGGCVTCRVVSWNSPPRPPGSGFLGSKAAIE
jgi:subtilisin family serine protease